MQLILILTPACRAELGKFLDDYRDVMCLVFAESDEAGLAGVEPKVRQVNWIARKRRQLCVR